MDKKVRIVDTILTFLKEIRAGRMPRRTSGLVHKLGQGVQPGGKMGLGKHPGIPLISLKSHNGETQFAAQTALHLLKGTTPGATAAVVMHQHAVYL